MTGTSEGAGHFRSSLTIGGMALTPQFIDALQYAAQIHADQLRKGTTIPYISHLLGVCSIVLEYGGSEVEAIGALLHDAAEDQGGDAQLAMIRTRFGDAVAEIVSGCTDTVVLPKPAWRKRKEDYIAHLPTASSSVLVVSLADKLHNSRAILSDFRQVGEELWARFQGGREGTLWYYRALCDAFHSLRSGALADELERVVSELEQEVNSNS